MSNEETTCLDSKTIDDVRDRRTRFLNSMEKTHGDNLAADPKIAKVYLTALADSDKQAQGNKRLETEDKNAQSMSSIAQSVHQVTQDIGRNSADPFRAKASSGPELVTPEVKVSGKFDIKQTETNVTPKSQNYETFMASQKGKKDTST